MLVDGFTIKFYLDIDLNMMLTIFEIIRSKSFLVFQTKYGLR